MVQQTDMQVDLVRTAEVANFATDRDSTKATDFHADAAKHLEMRVRAAIRQLESTHSLVVSKAFQTRTTFGSQALHPGEPTRKRAAGWEVKNPELFGLGDAPGATSEEEDLRPMHSTSCPQKSITTPAQKDVPSENGKKGDHSYHAEPCLEKQRSDGKTQLLDPLQLLKREDEEMETDDRAEQAPVEIEEKAGPEKPGREAEAGKEDDRE
ncbi:unnamed protein product [Caenorhabditis sp. 36 PRJEB53466]|nr:unnamed protein product [Caenorhabditis sp. 36 PRJEB53466]